jgi:hypothetical protein
MCFSMVTQFSRAGIRALLLRGTRCRLASEHEQGQPPYRPAGEHAFRLSRLKTRFPVLKPRLWRCHFSTAA